MALVTLLQASVGWPWVRDALQQVLACARSGTNGQAPGGGGGGASWGGILKGGNGADGAVVLEW